MAKPWPDDLAETARAMFFDDGATYLDIALKLSVTRNAVAGIFKRKGWKRGANVPNPYGHNKTRRKPGGNTIRKPKGVIILPIIRVRTNTINGMACQYMDGEAMLREFCGNPGYPWCDHHRNIVYKPMGKKAA